MTTTIPNIKNVSNNNLFNYLKFKILTDQNLAKATFTSVITSTAKIYVPTPSAGYTFKGWAMKDTTTLLDVNNSWYNFTGDVTIEAIWEAIDYSKVPSKAGLNYKEAFKKHDEDRYTKFIDAAVKGEVKINSAVLFPQAEGRLVRLSGRGGAAGRPAFPQPSSRAACKAASAPSARGSRSCQD